MDSKISILAIDETTYLDVESITAIVADKGNESHTFIWIGGSFYYIDKPIKKVLEAINGSNYDRIRQI